MDNKKKKDIYWDFQPAFYFEVEFKEMKRNGKKIAEKEKVAFKEVSGLNREMETETVREGGLNNQEYKLPKSIKHGNLIMKKALIPGNSGLVRNLKSTFEGYFTQPFIKQDILIYLLNPEGEAMHSWMCSDAHPVKWEVSSFDSEKNELVIEHVEFAYTTLVKRK